MNKTLLKLAYLKHYYQRKSLHKIDWSKPNKKDIEFNLAIQRNINKWKSSLKIEELAYLKTFEKEKFNKSNLNMLKAQSNEIKKHFVKVRLSWWWLVYIQSIRTSILQQT